MTNIANMLRVRNVSGLRRLATSASSLVLAAAVAGPLLLGAGQAHAAAADKDKQDKDNSTVSEVVVTAEYRSQNVQNTPISITAVNAAMLEERGITNIVDVASAVPNLSMRMGGSGSGASNQAFIRGIGQGDFLFAYSPRIAFYVDDVYFSTVYGSTFDLLDVSSVEVDRGPQGVLSGRNAAGGAIKIFSKQPTGDGSGYIEATGGSLSRFDLKAVMDAPIVQDKLALRLSAMHEQRDGWVTLDNFACVHPEFAGRLPGTGSNTSNGCKVGTLGAVNDWAVRAQLKWTVNEHVTDNLSADYTNSHDTASPDSLTAPLRFDNGNGTTPNGLGTWFGNIGGPDYQLPLSSNCLTGAVQAFSPVPRTYCPASPALAAALVPSSPYVSYASFGNPGLAGSNPAAENLPPGVPNYLDKNSNFIDPNVNNLKQWGLSNTLDLDFSGVHVKSITAWRGYSGVFGSSQSAIAVPIQEAYQGVSHHQFSQELVFTGSLFNKRLDWTAGGFFLNTGERNTGRVDFEGFAFFGGPDVQDFYIDDPATLRNRSGFVDGKLHITDQLSIEGGVRYSSETKTYAFTRHYVFYQGLSDPSVLNVTLKGTTDSESKWTPRAIINYQFTPDILGYASYTTGFTAGGINGRPFNTSTDIFPYGPEDVKAYEVGLKTELFDHHVRLNADVFDTDYSNIQVTELGTVANGHPTTVFFTANGGKANIKGFEAEAELRPIEDMLINASVGYTHFKYTEIDPGVSLTLNSPQTLVPDWTASIGAQYNFNIGNLGILTPRVDVNYQSKIYFNAAAPTDPLAVQNGYAMVNLRLTWRPMDTHWSVSGAVTNLTDKLYYTQKVNNLTAFGTAYGTVGMPREFSVTVRRSF